MGLSDAEVAEKIRQGKVNHAPKKQPNSIGRIVARNTLTIFNLVNLILAIMVLLVGSYKHLLFIFIAIANTLISIINEIRAKKTIDKMRLIAEQKPAVVRNGKTLQTPATDIVEGDLIVLSLGAKPSSPVRPTISPSTLAISLPLVALWFPALARP